MEGEPAGRMTDRHRGLLAVLFMEGPLGRTSELRWDPRCTRQWLEGVDVLAGGFYLR